MDECCESEAQGTHRCESGCNVVEVGGIKTECQNTLPVPPQCWVVLPDLSRLGFEKREIEKRSRPFEHQDLPQFVIRTALPIRGPSLAS